MKGIGQRRSRLFLPFAEPQPFAPVTRRQAMASALVDAGLVAASVGGLIELSGRTTLAMGFIFPGLASFLAGVAVRFTLRKPNLSRRGILCSACRGMGVRGAELCQTCKGVGEVLEEIP